MATGTLVEEVAEEVALNLEEVAEVTRRISAAGAGLFLGGLGLGLTVGFYFGHRWNKEKIRAEAFAQSEAEVETIREVYQQKALVLEKKPLEEIIERQGYSVAATEEQHERPLPPPVPITPIMTSSTPATIVEPQDGTPETVPVSIIKDKNTGWDYPKELQKRTASEPYVIHQDEFNADELGYEQTTFTYYSEDDVLVDTDDKPLPHGNEIVGADNLKFGHGTDDVDVVFVRNDKLQIEMEICRSPKSYESEVMGLNRDESA